MTATWTWDMWRVLLEIVGASFVAGWTLRGVAVRSVIRKHVAAYTMMADSAVWDPGSPPEDRYSSDRRIGNLKALEYLSRSWWL